MMTENWNVNSLQQPHVLIGEPILQKMEASSFKVSHKEALEFRAFFFIIRTEFYKIRMSRMFIHNHLKNDKALL